MVIVPRGFEDRLYASLMTSVAEPFYMDRRVEEDIAQYKFVEQTTSQVFVQSLAGASCCSVWSVFLIGYDPDKDFTVRSWLRNGRTLKGDEILVGAYLDFEIGTMLKFYGQEFHVADVLDASGTGLDSTIFIPIDLVYAMAAESHLKAEKKLEIESSDISAVLVRLKREHRTGLPALKAAQIIEKQHPEVGVLLPDDILKKTQRNLEFTLGVLRSASLAIWPVAAILVGLVFVMVTSERQREIGVLRSMGATARFVFQMVMAEAMITTGLGAILGLVLATTAIAAFSNLISFSLSIPFSWPGMGDLLVLFVLSTVIAVLTGALAALYPASKLSRMEPYEAIRRSEP